MCGIAGVIDLRTGRSPSPEVLSRMASAITHRGPDEEGYLRRPSIGFAARRLSIVGLEDGQQPIFNEDQNVAVVYNGEMFDYVERREQLQAAGHTFKTHADTEILPHLWEDHKEDMLATLRGQFAFALLDQRRRQIVLARDRFGICPLYWAVVEKFGTEWLVFGSEVKAILMSGLVEAKPDRRGIDQLFNFLAVPAPVTCFEGISLLQPGRFLSIKLGRNGERATIAERAYWTMDFPDAGDAGLAGTEKQLADGLEEVLHAAVKRRLRADVPVVSYLSGGVDSSMVVAMATKILGRAPPTFTVKILDKELDETPQAAIVSKHIAADPFVVPCGSEDIVNSYQSLLLAAESPVTDTSCTALMMLARRVREEGYKVALTGEGSDEWLAGYPWYKINRVLGTLGSISGGAFDKFARNRLKTWLGFDDDAVRYIEKLDRSAGGHNAFHDFYGLLNVSRFRFFSKDMLARLTDHDPYGVLEPDLDRVERWHPINKAIYWGGRVHLAGQLLSFKGDRIAMSQSVEVRYPFLDEDVFDYTAKLHPDWKLRGLREKYLLRVVAERWLPKEVAWRKKGMFRAPLDGFFLDTRLDYVDQLLSRESLEKTGYFDVDAVHRWKREYARLSSTLYRRSSMELGLVAVVATQLWHHTFIDPTLADLPDWKTLAGVANGPDALAWHDEDFAEPAS
ncbi:MAG: asparagine synthase (glutamine-hydrolyzing) [Hyphomicrobiaceae bacterium]|nr:asparagine synthase (glutamine-hydrolyzing) [Hyphomicrobiaceae bacterium]